MKITYGRNKMSTKTCKINHFDHLQKLIYTETMLKICNNIKTSRFLAYSPIQSSRYKHHEPTFKSKF